MPPRARRIAAPILVLAILLSAGVPAYADHKPASSIPVEVLLEPADFAATLAAAAAPRPLILQVGFRKAYQQAHIPGSEYVGAASDDDGLASLRQRVAGLPRESPIVLYCGCCPWNKCPNIAAAFDALKQEGFRNVKVIHIARDFGTNWVDQGFPAEKGS